MVNTMSNAQKEDSDQSRRRFLRWGLFLPIFVGALLMLSIGMADVILSYQATTSVGPNVATSLYYQDGTNYALAHADGYTTITCAGSLPATATPCGGLNPAAGQSTEAITLNGVESAAVYVVDLTEFAISPNFPAAGQTFNMGPVLVSSTLAGPTCAFVFVSTVAPTSPASLTGVQPSGLPAGCAIFEPAVASGSLEDVNLLTGAISNPTGCTGQTVTYVGGACAATTFYNGQAPYGAATTLLYFSLVVVSSATAPSGSATFTVNVVVV